MWGTRYIDALIQRKRDTGTDGSFDETHYALQDANFRVTAMTDSSGSVVERYRYTSYGSRAVLDSDWSSDSDGDSDVDMRIGHQGLYHDAVTGLVYNRNRLLHAQLGRFTSRDPLEKKLSAAAHKLRFEVEKDDLEESSISPELRRFLRSTKAGRVLTHRLVREIRKLKKNRQHTHYTDGMNLYQYLKSNPTRFTDAHGLFAGRLS